MTTGKVPGKAASNAETRAFGADDVTIAGDAGAEPTPALTLLASVCGAPEKSLDDAATCTCTSRPTQTSHSRVRPWTNPFLSAAPLIILALMSEHE